MQTNNSWEDPVVTKVNSLQDLGKLVQATEPQDTGKAYGMPEKKEPRVFTKTRAHTNPKLQEAMNYAEGHPEKTISEVAEKFGVNPQSIYSLRYKLRNKLGESVAERKCTREESLARAHAVRKAKAAENKVKRELEKEVRKKLKAEARKAKVTNVTKQGWLHSTLSTSAVPVTRPIGRPREAQATPLTIDYITRMNFSYSVGRAVECISEGQLSEAITHLQRELNK